MEDSDDEAHTCRCESMTRGICADNAEMDIWVDMMTVALMSAAVRCMASADEDNDKNWEQEVSSLLDVKSREDIEGAKSGKGILKCAFAYFSKYGDL